MHLGLRSEIIYTPPQFNFNFSHYVLNQDDSFVCYINADPLYVNQVAVPFSGFHVI